jgi:hypothetical protein
VTVSLLDSHIQKEMWSDAAWPKYGARFGNALAAQNVGISIDHLFQSSLGKVFATFGEQKRRH